MIRLPVGPFIRLSLRRAGSDEERIDIEDNPGSVPQSTQSSKCCFLLSIMRVKLARLVRVGGALPPFCFTFTITSKVAVYAPAEWADTLTLFHL